MRSDLRGIINKNYTDSSIRDTLQEIKIKNGLSKTAEMGGASPSQLSSMQETFKQGTAEQGAAAAAKAIADAALAAKAAAEAAAEAAKNAVPPVVTPPAPPLATPV